MHLVRDALPEARGRARLRVIGIGNRWRSDDGVGPVVAGRVHELAPGLEVVVQEGEPVALLDAFDGADAVVVVDAISSGGAPGTVHSLDAIAAPLPHELFARSTHHLGLGEAVELGRALGRLPARLLVVGVEGASWDAGDELSAPVAAAVDRAAAVVLEEVAQYTSAP